MRLMGRPPELVGMEGGSKNHRITPEDAALLKEEVASWHHFFLVTTFM
jgi:hypothetical protein